MSADTLLERGDLIAGCHRDTLPAVKVLNAAVESLVTTRGVLITAVANTAQLPAADKPLETYFGADTVLV